MRAYPALVDEGDSVAVRTFDTPAAQAAAMRLGTRRLLLLTVPSPVRELQRRLGNNAQLALAGAPHGGPGAVLADAITAAVDALIDEAGGPAWDEAGFARLRGHVAGGLLDTASEGARADRAHPRRQARGRAPARRGSRSPRSRPSSATSSASSCAWCRRASRPGPARGGCADVERYLTAAARRLERLPNAPGPDLDRMRSVHELEAAYDARLAGWPKGRPLPASLREVRWMLEELRVSHFAQALGTRGQISAKRIRRAIAEA